MTFHLLHNVLSLRVAVTGGKEGFGLILFVSNREKLIWYQKDPDSSQIRLLLKVA